MNRTKPGNLFSWLLLAAAVVTVSACSTTPKSAPSQAAQPEPVAPQVEIEPFEGDGMTIPVDGSSPEAFDKSLAQIKAYVPESTYTTLLDAIDYLLLYDLSAKRDKEKLIANLDGLTGYEILQKINWRKPAPGKGPAEIGAADAKIIDS